MNVEYYCVAVCECTIVKFSIITTLDNFLYHFISFIFLFFIIDIKDSENWRNVESNDGEKWLDLIRFTASYPFSHTFNHLMGFMLCVCIYSRYVYVGIHT